MDQQEERRVTILQDDNELESVRRYYNRWSRLRAVFREPAAELLGTMIMIMFVTGANCQAVLSSNSSVAPGSRGDFLTINIGTAIGVGVGAWISGGVSGAHLNPAVTIALAVFRGFPWKKVPLYILGQVLGACLGSLAVYFNYLNAIDIFEGSRGVRTVPGTASLFATYSLPYLPSGAAFYDEFLGTAILLIMILAITDKTNGPPPAGLNPLALTFLLLGIGVSFGSQTGYAINPARDLGPRIMTAMVGYGREVFTYRNQYWLWCPILGSLSGALLGALIYDLLIYIGPGSPINKPDARCRVKCKDSSECL